MARKMSKRQGNVYVDRAYVAFDMFGNLFFDERLDGDALPSFPSHIQEKIKKVHQELWELYQLLGEEYI